MQKYKFHFISISLVVGTLGFLFFLDSCTHFNFEYHPDNIVEEILEGIIKEKTGVDVDLTPSTPE